MPKQVILTWRIIHFQLKIKLLKSLYLFIKVAIFIGEMILSYFFYFPLIVFRRMKYLAIYILIYALDFLKNLILNIRKRLRSVSSRQKNLVSGLKAFIPEIPHLLLKSAFYNFQNFLKFVKTKNFKFYILGVLSTVLFFLIFEMYIFVSSLPSPRNIGKVNYAETSHIRDRNGKLLYEIYEDVNRTSVSIDSLPRYVFESIIAIEDKNFYKHHGVAIFGGVLRAIKDTYLYKDLQGGSTLTQQLVKTALLTPERTFERKIKEMIIAVWAELIYSKDEILEMYLNQVPFGGSAYGIEEAAGVYFGKTADKLTLAEAATLAGLPRAPSIYSPFVNPDLTIKRRNQVLAAMLDENYINQKQYNIAVNEELKIQPPVVNIKAPHFVMYTRQLLEDEYGIQKVQEGGLSIQTTLDLEIQQKAELILTEELNRLAGYNASNGSAVVLDAQTGEILAMIGSKNYYQGGWGAFNVATALRQPGSSLKPMLYALALERGFTAATLIDDSPIVFPIPGSEPYRPLNYDRRFHGKVPIRYALGNSYNIPAVKVLNTLGVQSYVDFARKLGIETWTDSSRFGLSLSLGGGEVTLLDLTQVFASFANGGYRIEPNPFLVISDSKGKILREDQKEKVRVIDEGVAFIIADILADNIARAQAFGINNPLYLPGKRVAAKTGTTNDYKDAWTVGFSDKYVVGVWVGNNNNAIMHKIAGSLGAGPIFNKIMNFLIEERGGGSIATKLPENVIGIPCYSGRIEYFIKGTESKSYCQNTFLRPTSSTPSP